MARMTSRMQPWTLYCQAGATEAKLSSEPESCMISAPSTVPIGETMPPTNSPPPMMTAPIESSVRPAADIGIARGRHRGEARCRPATRRMPASA